MALSRVHYEEGVARRLEEVFASAAPQSAIELGAARLIAFSDHHRGQRDGADDFQRCERAYNAALEHYFERGCTLVIVGDADELWECRPGQVIANYPQTLELEARFHQERRYHRIWGNHDDFWSRPGMTAQYLEPRFPKLAIRQGVRIPLLQGGEPAGELFFVHGHQGTTFSDRGGKLSRLAVHYLWRNVQRLTGRPLGKTPATDWELGREVDRAIQRWAIGKRASGLLLVAGHTHRPIFRSESHAVALQSRVNLAGDPHKRQQLQAKLERVRAKTGEGPTSHLAPIPCYFNTGCCCFGDGDVTGIEIADGEIRLVRWPDEAGALKPRILDRAPLGDVLRGIKEGRPAPVS